MDAAVDANANIDPALRDDLPNNIANPGVSPARSASGEMVPREAFESHLQTLKKKDPLREACALYGIRCTKKDNLERLRGSLLAYWYPTAGSSLTAPLPLTQSRPSSTRPPRPHDEETSAAGYISPDEVEAEAEAEDGDAALLRQYDVEGAPAQDLLGYDRDGLEEEDEEEDDGGGDVSVDLNDDDEFSQFQTRTRVDAAQRTEDNRRAGGKKTQKSIVISWNIFVDEALKKRRIRDAIVDEHSLLLYINHLGKRPKRNRRKEYIPGTRIGASQIKKEFFGALRIRKVQDARDPTLAIKRPATTVHVYDLVKTRMDEALQRVRMGLIPGEDAPDIVANTFLAQITNEQLRDVGYGFLKHRELRSTVNGHLAWTSQNASGNRGDDLRALKLCEMQPYTFLHPNEETAVYAVLGLQGEEKAGKRGMKTTINPTYTCFIAHRNPELCPLGAMAFYHHYVHDYYKLGEKLEINWSVNKSWRQVRLIFGSSPTTPYNESNLYNLYCQAYKKADFVSGIKAHMPRHQLGYQQEKMGVDAHDTAKLGWSNSTYMDTYAPALPKAAIIGAHGYKVHEDYNPIWRKVPVPEAFLSLMCPMAEGIVAQIAGRANLVGATNYWQMVILLRPHFFQCAAALFRVVPKSALFRLPALAREDVRSWMKTEFLTQLTALEAQAGSPVDLARMQNALLRQSLEEMRVVLRGQTEQITSLTKIIERRTAVLSPAKAYSHESYMRSADAAAFQPRLPALLLDPFQMSDHSTSHPSDLDPFGGPVTPLRTRIDPPIIIDEETRASEDTGIYEAPDSSLRGFVAPSPLSPVLPRPRTQVDLVLPPTVAFCEPGATQVVWPPVLGQRSVTWTEVFRLIRQPEYLWEVWRPSKSLDQMSLQSLWSCYNTGEPVVDDSGEPTGMKPPLRLVEQTFKASWRNTSAAKKAWQCFREIPEWIDSMIADQALSPDEAIEQLEGKRTVDGKLLGMNAFVKYLAPQSKAQRAVLQTAIAAAASLSTSDSTSTAVPSLSPSSMDPPSTPPPVKKRRAPTIGGRSKPKKTKR